MFRRFALFCIGSLLLAATARADTFADRSDFVLDVIAGSTPNLTQLDAGPNRIGRSGFWFGQGRLLRGDTTNGLRFIDAALNDVSGESSNAGFSLWPGMDAYYRWSASGLFSPAMLTKYRTAYTTVPDYDNAATFNQKFMTATGCYLATEVWGAAAVTAVSNASYGTGDPTGKAYLLKVIDDTPAYGFEEHNSNHYFSYTLSPLRTLANFAPDLALRNKAAMLFDFGVIDAAGVWLNGHSCASSARGGLSPQQNNYEITAQFWWLFFGGPAPAVTSQLYQTAPLTMTDNPPLLPEFLAAATERSGSYTQRSLSTVTAGPQIAHFKTTYMTPGYALWSAVEGEAGFYPDGSIYLTTLNARASGIDSYQAQRWALAWDNPPSGDSVLTITTPTTYSGSTGGISIYEDTLQKDDTLLVVYNIPATGGTGGNNGDWPNQYVKGRIPAGFLASTDELATHGRLLLHYNTVLVAIHTTTPFTLATDFILPCSKLGLAIETARVTDFPQATAAERLAAFRAAILANPGYLDGSKINDATPALTYTNRHGTVLSLTYGQAGVIDNDPVDYLQWPSLESPWAYKAQLGNLYIDGTDRTRLYDFNTWAILTNNRPVLAVTTPVATNGTNVIDIDLATRVTDAETPAANLLFAVTGATNGSVALLGDGRTARFTPAAAFAGASSFGFTATDVGVDRRLVLHYDFEAANPVAGNTVADASLNARPAAVVLAGLNAPTPAASVPVALTGRSTQSLRLPSTPAGGARLTRVLTPSNLNLSNQSWTFATWFRRANTSTDDTLLYIGSGDGVTPSGDELEVFGLAGQNTLTVRHTSAANLRDVNFTTADLGAPGAWRHLALRFERTSFNTGNLTLYVDGVLAGSATNITWALKQTTPLVFGGVATGTTYTRLLDGWLDDLAFYRGALAPADIARLAAGASAAQLGGLTLNGTVTLSGPAAPAPNPATPLAAAPAGLAVNQVAGSVQLAWNASANATGYTVRRAAASGGPYTVIATAITGLAFTDFTAPLGVTSFYSVAALTAGGEGSASSPVSRLALAAPANLTATAGLSSVALSWTASPGAATYTVRRATASNGPFTTLASGLAATSTTDSTAINGTTYFYTIAAVGPSAESAPSAARSATPAAAPVAAPVLSASPRIASVFLSWTAPANAATYTLKRATVSGGPYTTLASGFNATTYTDTAVINSTTYRYVVSAQSSGGTSADSAEASATPLPPATTFTNTAAGAWSAAAWSPAPPAQPLSDATTILRFNNTVGIASAHDLGSFAVNQLQLANQSVALTGDTLVFTGVAPALTTSLNVAHTIANSLVFDQTTTVTVASNFTALNGAISGNGGLIKAGGGGLVLGATNTFRAGTTLDGGSVTYTANNPSVKTLVFGNADASANVTALTLSAASLTATGLDVRTNSATANTVTLGSGRSLTINGNVDIGANSGATRLTLTGAGGVFTVTNPTNGRFLVGGSTNTATLDLSGLSTFTAQLGTAGSGLFEVGANGGTSTTSTPSSVILAPTSTITAPSISVGAGLSAGGNAGTQSLRLGSVATTLNTANLYVGSTDNNGRGSGSLVFNTTSGTLTVRGATGGTSRANLYVAHNNYTGSSASTAIAGTVNLSGAGESDLRLGTLTIATPNAGAVSTGIFTFASGTLDVNTVNLAATINTSRNATGTFNLTGGTAVVNTAFNLGRSASTGVPTASLNLTGGSLTLAGPITTSALANSTLVLNGATLDLAGNALGDAVNPIDTLTIQAGTLRNVGLVNGTAGLTKTTSGVLALGGLNTFTGPLHIDAGVLAPQGDPSVAGAFTLGAGGTLRVRLNGASVGTGFDQLTVGGAITLAGNVEVVAAPGLVAGTRFTILRSAAPVVGTFLGRPGHTVFTAGGYSWFLTYEGDDVVLTLATALDLWRHTHLGTTANTGTAADTADFDRDGVSNLLEYALGTVPTSASSVSIPTASTSQLKLQLTFLRAHSDVTYHIEASSDLSASSWTVIATNPGTVGQSVTVSDTVNVSTANPPRRFLRLRVTVNYTNSP